MTLLFSIGLLITVSVIFYIIAVEIPDRKELHPENYLSDAMVDEYGELNKSINF